MRIARRCTVFLLSLVGPLHSQGEIKSFPPVDPYTKNAPEAIERAGYASFGPFRFGEDHTTEQLATTLGGIPLIFVETEHFKLGSGLPEYALGGDPIEKERLKEELERLARKLPSIKTKVKKLDPWLRLHLYAQRLEELYASFLHSFGLTEGEFPATPPDPKTETGAYMGEGRYLGMSSKFTVLLFAKKSALARYSTVYLGKTLSNSTRWYLPITDSWLFLTCVEALEGDYANDSGLACDVLSGVSQNLATGFRGPRVALPFAVTEGIGHCFSRGFDERYHLFSGLDPSKILNRNEANWATSVRARVEHNVYPPLGDMLAWTDAEALEWADHLMLWSRMDYVLRREDGLAGRLLRLLKEPADTENGPLSPEELLLRGKQAYQEAAGKELTGLDTDWAEWVLGNYPKK